MQSLLPAPSTFFAEKFEDVFSNLTLSRAPFSFPTLTEEERQFIEVYVGGRSFLDETGLEVMRQLKSILIIPLGISIIYDDNYNCYLVLIGQITFNVRSFLV
jgi:hypothetical protein